MGALLQARLPSFRGRHGSYQADHLTRVTRTFQTDWFKVPLLGHAGATIRWVLSLGGA